MPHSDVDVRESRGTSQGLDLASLLRDSANWPPPDAGSELAWMRVFDQMAPIAAWGTIGLFLSVPIFVFVAVQAANPLWIIWTLVSLWGALDAPRLAEAAFPGWPLRNPARVIGLLAAVNLLVSLYALVLAVAPAVAGH